MLFHFSVCVSILLYEILKDNWTAKIMIVFQNIDDFFFSILTGYFF